MNRVFTLIKPSVILGLVFVFIISGLLELGARMPGLDRVSPPSVGSSYSYFDFKVGELDTFFHANGDTIDCIFFGSSVVRGGLDPVLFETAYFDATGEQIACYNFGLPGLKTFSAAFVGQLLIDRYNPRLLIYGFTQRAFSSSPRLDSSVPLIFESDWVKYQKGEMNFIGWFIDHSMAYRRYLGWKDWPSPNFSPPWTFASPAKDGYHPMTERVEYDGRHDFYLEAFEVGPEEWAGLEKIVALNSQTNLLLVAMPVEEMTFGILRGGKAYYRQLLDEIKAIANAQDVMMWSTVDLNLVSQDDFVGDAHHLHQDGAAIFSTWLGSEVGRTALLTSR